MVLYMNMKQLGKRRNTVDQVPFTYVVAPGSLRELITETVKLCVSRYIEAMNRGEAVLSNAQIDDMAQIGKIAFGIVYGENRDGGAWVSGWLVPGILRRHGTYGIR